jgi:TusA-related sulfurtransferase
MSEIMAKKPDKFDYFLDITTDVCPMTFVKTKLLIERMSVGETAEIRLPAGEPLENVPRAVEEHGHMLLDLVPESGDCKIYLMSLRKM